MTTTVRRADLAVPDDETPAARCPHCDRPFRTERLQALHVGEVHDEQCTDDQQEAYDDAREEENEELFMYHLKVVGALVGIYSFFLFTYMAVAAIQAPGGRTRTRPVSTAGRSAAGACVP